MELREASINTASFLIFQCMPSPKLSFPRTIPDSRLFCSKYPRNQIPLRINYLKQRPGHQTRRTAGIADCASKRECNASRQTRSSVNTMTTPFSPASPRPSTGPCASQSTQAVLWRIVGRLLVSSACLLTGRIPDNVLGREALLEQPERIPVQSNNVCSVSQQPRSAGSLLGRRVLSANKCLVRCLVHVAEEPIGRKLSGPLFAVVCWRLRTLCGAGVAASFRTRRAC